MIMNLHTNALLEVSLHVVLRYLTDALTAHRGSHVD